MQNIGKKRKTLKRRDFIKSITRTGIFTSLVGGSAYLVLRKKNNTDDCSFDFVCQNCRKNSFCKLPEASIFRINKRKLVENEKTG